MIRFQRAPALSILLVFLALAAPPPSRAADDDLDVKPIGVQTYKPIYAIAGNPYGKIQVSFKANLYRGLPLYFGYSQLMFWDVWRESPKFHDLNYNPDLFYRFEIDKSRGQWLDLGLWEHESNGKGDADERSWDRMYLRARTRSKLGDFGKFYLEGKAWFIVARNGNNENIAQYRGLWEVTATLSEFFGHGWERGDVSLRLYPGGPSLNDPTKGGQELTFRSGLPETNGLPVFVAQVFHGYAENLSDYSDERWGIRAGFGF